MSTLIRLPSKVPFHATRRWDEARRGSQEDPPQVAAAATVTVTAGRIACTACNGDGLLLEEPCPLCDGEGSFLEEGDEDDQQPSLSGSPVSSSGGLATKKSSGTFEHVFTPKHCGCLEEHYIVEEVLGEGSFGKIFRGHARGGSLFHPDECHTVRAIKSVSADVTPARFNAEVGVQKQLDHPNIAKLYEVFQDKSKYYLVLELCTGGELFDKVVEAGGHFSEGTCASSMRQLLAAVKYLHGHRVAHRDIKPENLLLQSRATDAHLKLIDFGCARTFAPGEVMRTSLGTPLYVAPQVLRRRYTAKCDVWSCGVIMFVLLSGTVPFLGVDEQDLLRRIQKGAYDFEDEDWDDVSESAKDLINKMLTMDEAARPGAEALLEHDWLLFSAREGRACLSEGLVTRLRAFKAVSQFKKVALSLAAQLSSDEDILELQDTFLALDSDQDGSLTLTEVAEGLSSHGISLPADITEILSSVDTDGSGSIDYTEFIASTMSRKQYLKEDVLWSVFSTFDLNGDGKIQREEFEQVVHMNNRADMAQMFEEADSSGKGEIDFADFCAVMRKPSKPALDAPATPGAA